MTDEDFLERMRIREVVENWVVLRDAADWSRFRKVWHDGARMMSTYFQGSAERYTEIGEEAWRKGAMIHHHLEGSFIDVAGDRAIAQTRMSISVRAPVEGVLCDVVCTGRFYDFFEKRNGSWAIVLRQPIYEKDRIDPVEPGAAVGLDPKLLGELPSGYRHLAYMQVKAGMTVKRDMPMLRGPEVETLYRHGAAWLAGKALSR